jgi:hypothetical protein
MPASGDAGASPVGASPKLALLARRNSFVGSASASDEERDGLLCAPAAPAAPAAPPPSIVSWRVYRTVALLSLTTMFVFADQNLMARVASSVRAALCAALDAVCFRRRQT